MQQHLHKISLQFSDLLILLIKIDKGVTLRDLGCI